MRLTELLEGKFADIKKRNGELPIYEVKTKAEYNGLMRKFKGFLRGICFDDNKLIVWDANEATHSDVIPHFSSGEDGFLFSTWDNGESIEVYSHKVTPQKLRQSTLGRFISPDTKFIDHDSWEDVTE